MSVSKFSLHLAVLTMLAWPLAEIASAQRDGGGRSRDGGGRSAGRDSGGQRGGGNARSGDGSARNFTGQGTGQGNRSGNRSGREFSARPGGDGGRTFSGSPSRQAQNPQGLQGQNPQGQSTRRQFEQQQRQSRESYYRGPDGARQLDGRGRANRDGQFDRDDFQRAQRERDAVRERDNRNDDDRNGDQITRDFNRDRFENDRDRDRDFDRNRNDWDRYSRDRDNWRGDGRRDWWRSSGRDVPFRYGWWDNYYGAGWPNYSPWRYSRWRDRPYYWWSWTPADRLSTWIVYGWDRPRYWTYGPGGNIYYQDNYVYYDNQRYKPADEYYQYVYDLAHSVPQIDQQRAEQMDWRPLGVFALSRQNESQSERAIQLAVSKEGIVTGTYFNRQDGHVHPVSGMIDEETQRAAWAFADGEHPEVVFESIIFSLTQPESTIMVHFGSKADQAEIWQAVRQDQPEDQSDSEPLPSGMTNSLP
jgi:hypothetical protein